MEWFIKKNATLPVLKINIFKDGRSDYNRSMKDLNQDAIFFSMVNVDTNVPRITSRPAGVMERPSVNPTVEPDYYVYYQFTPLDTKVVGRYKAQFLIRNETGVLILPLNDELYVNVTDSFIIDDLPYDSCYVIDFLVVLVQVAELVLVKLNLHLNNLVLETHHTPHNLYIQSYQ